jgi:hypothetical protein
MPETGRTGKPGRVNLRQPETIWGNNVSRPARRPSKRQHRAGLRARRRREVAQTFSGRPLTTDCRTGTLYPETATVTGWPTAAIRGLQASVSPAPCVADSVVSPTSAPPLRMDRNLARCRLAYRDIAKWTGSRGPEVFDGIGAYRSEASLLLLLGGDLALGRRLLLRGGLRLRCLLHHVALLVGASDGVASAPTRIVGTASSITTAQRKKTSSPLTKRVRSGVARMLKAINSAARGHATRRVSHCGGDYLPSSSELQMCPSNGRFLHMKMSFAGARAGLLTALAP